MSHKSGSLNYPIEFMRIAGVLLIALTHTKHSFTSGIPFFILETLPKYGTPLLSVISGYLFYCYRNAPGLLPKKAKSLLVPYLIANIAVLLPVVVIYQFGFNYLDRLTYNYTLITEGLFALNAVPVNPPTYFIRDLFIIFCLLAVVKKDFRGLFFIVPVALFGALLLRPDIAVLFTAGFLIKKFSIDAHARYRLYTSLALIPLAVAGFFFFTGYELHKYFIALLVFINVVPMKFTFARTGAFTYLLHLYHAPIIVFMMPFLRRLGLHPLVDVTAQVALAIFFTYVMFIIVKRLKLGIIVGHRL